MSSDDLLRLLPWLIASATTGACAAATAQLTRFYVTAEEHRSFAQVLRSFARQVRE